MFNISNQRRNQLIIAFRAINEVFWASECTKGHEPMFAGQGTVLSLWRIEPSQSNLNCASKRKYDSQPKIQK